MKKVLCLVLALMTLLSVTGAAFASGEGSDWEDDYDGFDKYGFPVRGVYETDDEYREGVKAFKKCDYGMAIRHFRNSAQRGYAWGQYEYANCMENGWGCKKNLEKAFEYYFYASEQGHSKAQAALGRCYLWGRATFRDYDEAVRLFTLSAEQDDDLGQLWLGYCYQNGYGVNRDPAEARYWYRLSAAQGNASAKKRLQEF